VTHAVPSWQDAETARAYDAFAQSHPRYRDANAALVRAAALASHHRVLDVGAGTGATAVAVLGRLGAAGRVVCFEPSTAMRRLGQRGLHDARVTWRARLPVARPVFERVVCGASVWLLGPFGEAIAGLAARVAPGGALAFNVPAAYVGVREPQGPDPLAAIPAWLARAGLLAPGALPASPPPPAASEIDRLLAAAGLRARRWRTRVRLTQAAYRDWLAIPVVSAGMLGGVEAAERARRLDAALAHVDRSAWRWETWLGWTAWKG
jgi:SAM-dependent methyltransferase